MPLLRPRHTFAAYLVIFIAAAVYILPPLVATRGMSVRMDTDYMALVPMYHFIADYIRSNGAVPAMNPYTGTGIPVIGDPLSGVLNPFLMVPLILYGTDTGLRVYFFIVILLAGYTMLLFLRSIGVEGIAGIWGAVLYLVSGAGAAKLASGQMENLLSFSLFPLLFYSVFRHPMRIRDVFIAALALTLMWFSGGLYSVWHAVILISAVRFYYLVSKLGEMKTVIRDWAFVLFLFIFFSLPKFMDYVIRVVPILYRSVPGYNLGSIHAPFFLVQFIMPFQVGFYDRPFFQRWIGFYYNWYEYYAFISPLPFLFLYRIKSVKNTTALRLCLLLVLVAALHVAVKYEYSPFLWFYETFTQAQMFRVPQRIVMPAASVVVAALSLCAYAWLHSARGKLTRLMIVSVLLSSTLWTLAVSQRTVYGMYEPIRTEGRELAAKLRKSDTGTYSVAIIPCCLQLFFVEQHIPVLNYYYGWKTSESARFRFVTQNDTVVLSDGTLRPTYIITDGAVQTVDDYVVFFETTSYKVWKTERPTITPSI